MFPSTNTLVAAPEPPGPDVPAVSRVIDTVFTVNVADALATNVPATSELITTVHCPLASVPVLVPLLAQLSVTDPGVGDNVTTGNTPAWGCSPAPPPASPFTV